MVLHPIDEESRAGDKWRQSHKFQLRSALNGRSHLFEFSNLSAQCGDLGAKFVDFGGVAQSTQREVCDLTSDFFTHLAFQNFGTLPYMLRQFVDDLFDLVFGFRKFFVAVGLILAGSGGDSIQAVFQALASYFESSSCKEEKFHDRANHNSNLRIAGRNFRELPTSLIITLRVTGSPVRDAG